ncbi:MAG: ATP synthase F1 subunit gamma [Bacteroidota bacterium]
MATLREIRRRIASIQSTQQITKAMKMVAAAKLRRAQENIFAARPYARKMNDLLRHLVTKVDPALHPLLAQREVRQVALIVVTSDRGLCGAFNVNLIRAGMTRIETAYKEHNDEKRLKIIPVGKKGYDFFLRRGVDVTPKHVGVFSHLGFHHAQQIMGEITEAYRLGEVDKVEVIYNEFKSVLRQNIVVEQLLPIPPEAALEEEGAPQALVDYIYEPNSSELITALIPKHLNFQMWRILLESNAAEQGAKMTAMDNATENANELIGILQLQYNKARQAAITKELLEIVSGAEALRKAG